MSPIIIRESGKVLRILFGRGIDHTGTVGRKEGLCVWWRHEKTNPSSVCGEEEEEEEDGTTTYTVLLTSYGPFALYDKKRMCYYTSTHVS